MKAPLFLRGEEAHLVAFQLTGHPVQLVVKPQPSQGLLAQRREGRIEALHLPRQHTVLQLGQPVLQLLQMVQFPGQQLFQKLAEKPPRAVFPPALFLAQPLEDGMGRAGVVAQHHPVPGEQIPEGHTVPLVAPAGYHHRAAEAVPAHLRLAYPGIPGAGRVVEYPLQPRQPGIAVQLLRGEQENRRRARRRRRLQQRQALTQTIDIHGDCLPFPAVFSYCTTKARIL